MGTSGSFSSFGTHAVACSSVRETDDMSASFPSSRFAVRHHSNVPGAFLSTMSFQDARCGTAFPGNACPTVQDWGQVCSFQGKNCGGFGAFTKNGSQKRREEIGTHQAICDAQHPLR